MALNLDYVARETAHNLRRNFTLTVAALLTVVVSLTLVGIALLVRQAASNASGKFRGHIELIVFMQPKATQAQIAAVGSSLKTNPEVKHYSFVDHQEAYAQAKKLFKNQPAFLEGLKPADLPTSYPVVPVNPDFQSITAMTDQYSKVPGVYTVESPEETIKALQKVTKKINAGVFFAALTLLGVAIMLIFNTIRTAMFARRREIEVMKLVGATDWFIRVPFILEGLIQGVLGGLLAFGALAIYNHFLTTQLLGSGSTTNFFQNFVVATPDVISSGLVVLLVGAVVGAFSSALAVGRFLDV
jgi:cell division transport system permease protein